MVYACFFLCVFLQGAEIWTPVLLASDYNHVDVLEVLIQHGAQLDVRNKVSITIALSTQYHTVFMLIIITQAKNNKNFKFSAIFW